MWLPLPQSLSQADQLPVWLNIILQLAVDRVICQNPRDTDETLPLCKNICGMTQKIAALKIVLNVN